MKPAKILQHIALYPFLARFRFKKDIPKHIQGRAITASFGLWGNWFIVIGLNGLVTSDGREMPFHEAWLDGVGRVIGRRDASAASNTPMDEAWRESIHNAINTRLGLEVA